MTDRHAGYIVALNRDIREDDAEAVINALRMVKGVLSVEPVVAGGTEQSIAETRRDAMWRDALWALAEDGPLPPDGGGT